MPAPSVPIGVSYAANSQAVCGFQRCRLDILSKRREADTWRSAAGLCFSSGMIAAVTSANAEGER